MTKYTLPMVKNHICYKPFAKENTIYLVCLRFKGLAWKEMFRLNHNSDKKGKQQNF